MDLLIYALCLTIATKTNSISGRLFWFYAAVGIAYGVFGLIGLFQ